MIYLDYAASTPIDPEVLKTYGEIESSVFANANATHALGVLAQNTIADALNRIAHHLNVQASEIIMTSGAVESNNLALKGLAKKYPHKKHIISSELEHSSLIGPLSALEREGFTLDFVRLNAHGQYDEAHLAELIRSDTLVVTLIAVDSETGIRHNVEACARVAHEKGTLFHSDMTQTLGRCRFDLSNIDLATFSGHKIYGPKGIGCLIKKEGVELIPLFNGNRGLSVYRPASPQNGLIAAFAKAVDLAFTHFETRHAHVQALNTYVRQALAQRPSVLINSTAESLPHVLNFSVVGTQPAEVLAYFSTRGIYFTSKSACTLPDVPSRSIYALTLDKARAQSSYRISLSHLTTQAELDQFLNVLDEVLSA
jgi:cysteine desulfurase